ncbi:MAG: hypothetical protein ACQEXJ_23600, partial [Myxococcota bacterium]
MADEVGLGKTMVARGVIAKAVRHLQEHTPVDRIDVVYVCSNASIARQNVNRLKLTKHKDMAFASRLTLLPAELSTLTSNQLNFVSFTPGTTFDLKSSQGIVDERAIIYRMLRGHFGDVSPAGLYKVFRHSVNDQRWERLTRAKTPRVDPGLTRIFQDEVRGDPELLDELVEVCAAFRHAKSWNSATVPRRRATAVIGNLRRVLAFVCITSLEPDLVILDEFQRFSHLLHDDSDAGKLARALMNYRDTKGHCRTLLLSATPYRMLTLHQEEGGDHYEELVDTLRFLFDGDEAQVEAVRGDLDALRLALYRQGTDGDADLDGPTERLRKRLMRVMCRTERVAFTKREDAMLVESPTPVDLDASDLVQACAADRVSRAVGAGNVLEYWKSAPYPLNFMKGYVLKRKLRPMLEAAEPAAVAAVKRHASDLLSQRGIERYQPIDPAHGRMRALLREVVESGMWRLLWMPPSLPYTEPAGPWADVGPVTKALVFSAWNVAPDALATLCSYEVERRIVAAGGGRQPDYSELMAAKPGLLRLTRREDGLSGMSTLAMLYPSPELARCVDPLAEAMEAERPSPDALRERVEERLRSEWSGQLDWDAPEAALEDEQWHWAVFGVVDQDRSESVLAWCRSPEGWSAIQKETDHDTAFDAHIGRFFEGLRGDLSLGRPPEDLWSALAELALGSPAVCAARALRRVAPELAADDPGLMTAAARIAWGFRSLFNNPEARCLVEEAGTPYWR